MIFIRFKVNTQQPNQTFQVWIKLDFFLPFILYYQILYGSKLSAETKQIQTHFVDMNEILEYSCIFMMLFKTNIIIPYGFKNFENCSQYNDI